MPNIPAIHLPSNGALQIGVNVDRAWPLSNNGPQWLLFQLEQRAIVIATIRGVIDSTLLCVFPKRGC